MSDIPRAAAIRGTMRWAWTDGPTKGRLVGFASGSQAWYPLRGTCERVR
jgi:hypothetical protein